METLEFAMEEAKSRRKKLQITNHPSQIPQYPSSRKVRSRQQQHSRQERPEHQAN
jgi:hypothetical protein